MKAVIALLSTTYSQDCQWELLEKKAEGNVSSKMLHNYIQELYVP